MTAMKISLMEKPKITNEKYTSSTSCTSAMSAVTPAERPPIFLKRSAMYTSKITNVMSRQTRHFWKNFAPMVGSTELDSTTLNVRSAYASESFVAIACCSSSVTASLPAKDNVTWFASVPNVLLSATETSRPVSSFTRDAISSVSTSPSTEYLIIAPPTN